MTPGPDPAQRARDARLAWIIVGGSAVLTVVVLIVALAALSGPVARWAASQSAANISAPAPSPDAVRGKTESDAQDSVTNLTGDDPSAPATDGEVRKHATDDRHDEDVDDDASVRRGQGPRDDVPPARRSGPIA